MPFCKDEIQCKYRTYNIPLKYCEPFTQIWTNSKNNQLITTEKDILMKKL